MTTPSTTESKSPLKFFLLVFALSVPLWLIDALAPLDLLPGFPATTLNVFCPLIAASILVYREDREDKTAGVVELLKRSFDYRRISAKVWYIPTVLLNPGIAVLAYGLMRLWRVPLPAPQFSVLAALTMFLASFIAALGEELGWSGYAADPMLHRRNALQASVLLGFVWAAWHVVPLVQAQRSLAWIAWWFLSTVALRVLIVWLYNNTGKSVFATALFHAISNVSTLLFPEYYDPRVTGLITALAAVIVTVGWGPRTLTRNRNA
jgi:membrane protease YdiL (CAAX protease family)